jgi:RNA polymerase sigma-70 factor (ECF subfamily)
MNNVSTESVWTALGGDLRRFIRRRVPDDHVADDLLQETFVRIHRSIGQLSDADRLTSWVYRIARNVIHDEYRRTGRDAVPLEGIDVTADPAPADRAACNPCGWWDELIRQLPDEYRTAVELAEIQGLSQQEVADRLGLSLSGAKSRVQRGRRMLRDELNQCCEFHFDRRGNLLEVDPRPERTVCRDCESVEPAIDFELPVIPHGPE